MVILVNVDPDYEGDEFSLVSEVLDEAIENWATPSCPVDYLITGSTEIEIDWGTYERGCAFNGEK